MPLLNIFKDSHDASDTNALDFNRNHLSSSNEETIRGNPAVEAKIANFDTSLEKGSTTTDIKRFSLAKVLERFVNALNNALLPESLENTSNVQKFMNTNKIAQNFISLRRLNPLYSLRILTSDVWAADFVSLCRNTCSTLLNDGLWSSVGKQFSSSRGCFPRRKKLRYK